MDATALPAARRAVARRLREAGCSNVDDVLLVFAELTTNAVVHGGGATRISVALDGNRRVHVDVHDNSSDQPFRRPRSSQAGGLGLHLVHELSEHWGVRATSIGKVVWAVVPCADDPPVRAAIDAPPERSTSSAVDDT